MRRRSIDKRSRKKGRSKNYFSRTTLNFRYSVSCRLNISRDRVRSKLDRVEVGNPRNLTFTTSYLNVQAVMMRNIRNKVERKKSKLYNWRFLSLSVSCTDARVQI